VWEGCRKGRGKGVPEMGNGGKIVCGGNIIIRGRVGGGGYVGLGLRRPAADGLH